MLQHTNVSKAFCILDIMIKLAINGTKMDTHPSLLNTRIQAWTLGPIIHKHLSVVIVDSRTPRENVSTALL